MSVAKKLIFPILLFIGFIVYTVYSFDYETVLNNKENNVVVQKPVEIEEVKFLDKIKEFKKDINTYINGGIAIEEKFFNLVLTKKNGLIVMDGLFAKKEDARKVFYLLNINQDGEYKYEKDVLIDYDALEKLLVLTDYLKNNFTDDSVLSFIDNEIKLTGELIDLVSLESLKSTISTMEIKIKLDIQEPVEEIKVAEQTEIIEESIPLLDNNSNEISVVNEKVEDNQNSDKIINNNLASTPNEIQLVINRILSNNKITFQRRSTKITDDSYSTVEKVAKILMDNPTLKVEIAGHTDSRGKKSLNKEISQNRANGVKDVLVSLGISKNRIKAVGYGEEFPIAVDDENGLSEINRRVEINIIGEL